MFNLFQRVRDLFEVTDSGARLQRERLQDEFTKVRLVEHILNSKPSSTISKLSLKMEVASHWLSEYDKPIDKKSN